MIVQQKSTNFQCTYKFKTLSGSKPFVNEVLLLFIFFYLLDAKKSQTNIDCVLVRRYNSFQRYIQYTNIVLSYLEKFCKEF